MVAVPPRRGVGGWRGGRRHALIGDKGIGAERWWRRCGIAAADWAGGRTDWIAGEGPPLSAAIGG